MILTIYRVKGSNIQILRYSNGSSFIRVIILQAKITPTSLVVNTITTVAWVQRKTCQARDLDSSLSAEDNCIVPESLIDFTIKHKIQ